MKKLTLISKLINLAGFPSIGPECLHSLMAKIRYKISSLKSEFLLIQLFLISGLFLTWKVNTIYAKANFFLERMEGVLK